MITFSLDQILQDNSELIKILQKGEIIVFPSDTVYGLLVDAKNPGAVKNLLQFKERPPGKAISIFCSPKEMILSVCDASEEQVKLMDKLLPGPYTIILPSKKQVQKELESEKGTLGVRIPKFEPVLKLVETFRSPLTATSANLSGDNPHYSIDSLLNSLSEKKKKLIGAIVDAGKLPRNKPSTVIDLTENEVTVLRVGDTLLEQKQAVVTKSEEETKDLAQQLVKQFGSSKKPLVFILKGDLGSGKTVFTKGLAEHFDINDVISPTFVIYYEYDISEGIFKHLYHFDLYNIMEEEEFNHLGVEALLVPGNVLVFEWGEKLGKLYEAFKEKAQVVYIELEHVDEKKRRLAVHMNK